MWYSFIVTALYLCIHVRCSGAHRQMRLSEIMCSTCPRPQVPSSETKLIQEIRFSGFCVYKVIRYVVIPSTSLANWTIILTIHSRNVMRSELIIHQLICGDVSVTVANNTFKTNDYVEYYMTRLIIIGLLCLIVIPSPFSAPPHGLLSIRSSYLNEKLINN